jgi:ribonuclease P/MRP protein subunit POP3
VSRPPKPEMSEYIDVGLANISRNLGKGSATALSDSTKPMEGKANERGVLTGQSSTQDKKSPYSVVFIERSGHPPAFVSHFPQMVGALSPLSNPEEGATRLVGFSRPCEEKLSTSIGFPRVSSIALRADAPGAEALVNFVRERVAPIDIAWLRQAQAGEYLDVKIDAVETLIGTKKQKVV